MESHISPVFAKGLAVQNPLRRRNRAVAGEPAEEVQQLVFDLVRERLVAAFGADGMWSVSTRGHQDVDNFFSETVAESLAWNIASQLAPPQQNRHEALAEPHKLPIAPEMTSAAVAVSARLVA